METSAGAWIERMDRIHSLVDLVVSRFKTCIEILPPGLVIVATVVIVATEATYFMCLPQQQESLFGENYRGGMVGCPSPEEMRADRHKFIVPCYIFGYYLEFDESVDSGPMKPLWWKRLFLKG